MIIERVDDPDLFAQVGQSASSGIRTLGVLHLSDIYSNLMKRLQPARFGAPIDDDARRRMEVGILFEQILEKALIEKYATVRPGEIVSPEGIFMSPDGANPTLDAGEEYKATWMSCRVADGGHLYLDELGHPNDKFQHWFFQMMGYAKWLNTTRFLLRTLFINGDYSRPYTPQLLTHLIQFSQEEIDGNWIFLMNHAREEGLLPG